MYIITDKINFYSPMIGRTGLGAIHCNECAEFRRSQFCELPGTAFRHPIVDSAIVDFWPNGYAHEPTRDASLRGL